MKKAGNIARKYQLGAITLEFTEEGTIELTRGPTRTTNPERLTWRQGPAYEILTDFVHALATDGPGVEPPHAVAFRDAVRKALFKADPEWATREKVSEALCAELAISRLKNDADHAKAAELNAIDRMENANTERDNWQAGAKKICDENEELLRKIAYLGDQVISLTGQNATLQSDLMLARDQRNDAQSVNQSYSKTVTELRSQNATLQSDLATARSLLDVGAARVKEVTEQNETLARSLAEIATVAGIAKSFGCKGKNCGYIDPRHHSSECQTEHEEAVGGYYGSEDTTPYAAEQLRRYIWILTGEEPAQDVAERIVDDISRILNN